MIFQFSRFTMVISRVSVASPLAAATASLCFFIVVFNLNPETGRFYHFYHSPTKLRRVANVLNMFGHAKAKSPEHLVFQRFPGDCKPYEIIPTRSNFPCSKLFCLDDLASSVSIIRILRIF